MKILGIVISLLTMAASAGAKPMTSSVASWEGQFGIVGTNTPIRIRGLPTIHLWKYELPSGSQGVAVGFSTADGDMLKAPEPATRGVQPIYLDHIVSLSKDGIAEILVMYSVQGNGGWRSIEKYIYDGKSIRMDSRTFNSGKREFEWFREDGEQSLPPVSGTRVTPAAYAPVAPGIPER